MDMLKWDGRKFKASFGPPNWQVNSCSSQINTNTFDIVKTTDYRQEEEIHLIMIMSKDKDYTYRF